MRIICIRYLNLLVLLPHQKIQSIFYNKPAPKLITTSKAKSAEDRSDYSYCLFSWIPIIFK